MAGCTSQCVNTLYSRYCRCVLGLCLNVMVETNISIIFEFYIQKLVKKQSWLCSSWYQESDICIQLYLMTFFPQHNTTGINCEKCVFGFYRPYDVPRDAIDACRRECFICHCVFVAAFIYHFLFCSYDMAVDAFAKWRW